jgi:hypothetical protein
VHHTGSNKVDSFINRVERNWNVIGFLDDVKYGRDSEFMGYPILGNRRNIDGYNGGRDLFCEQCFGTTKNREKSIADAPKKKMSVSRHWLPPM